MFSSSSHAVRNWDKWDSCLLVSLTLGSLLVLLLLSGCSINQAYKAADRATYDAIAGEYVAYVGSDTALSDKQKQRRAETVASWEARLDRE